MSDDYETGYKDGSSSGYNDWIAALDALPVEVEHPSDVLKYVAELQAEIARLQAALKAMQS